jgi:hypothetical protein
MQIEHSENHPVSYYGKKVYYFNPLIARKETTAKNEPSYLYEDTEDDKG